MIIVVTGQVGAGKSTVCRKVIDLYRQQGYECGGIISYKDTDNNIIAEDIRTGIKMILASRNTGYEGLRTGAYYFNPEGLEFGKHLIEKEAGSYLLVVDEIGPLELARAGFSNAITLMNGKKVGNSIVVIRRGLLGDFLPKFKNIPLVFETTLNNRNVIPAQIDAALTPLLG